LKTNGCRGVCLRIAINEQGRLFSGSQASCQIDRSGSLAYSTFLIRNSDNAGQCSPPNLRKLTKSQTRCKMFHVEHHSNCGFSVGIPFVPRGTYLSNHHKTTHLRGLVLQKSPSAGLLDQSVPRGTHVPYEQHAAGFRRSPIPLIASTTPFHAEHLVPGHTPRFTGNSCLEHFWRE